MKGLIVYLGIPKTAGGAFQYSLSLIRSLALYQNIKLIVRHHDVYEYILETSDFSKSEILYFPFSKLEFYLEVIYRKMGLPVWLYRKLLFRLFPVNRFLSLQKGCCIFPAQDSKAYLVPQDLVIGTVHDLMHLYEYRFKELSSSGIRNTHYQSLVDYCDAVLVDSELGKTHLIENFKVECNDKVKVLPFCVPATDLILNVKTSRFDDGSLSRFIFYPAQFWEHKNHRTLVLAFSRLVLKYPELKLVLSGATKNNYYSIKSLVETLGLRDKVVFCGYIDQSDLSWLYQNCAVFVMASFCGPTNIPPLEALYFGVPIVISDVYAHREQCGEAALYFDPSSVEDLISKVEMVFIADTANQMRHKALDRSKLFTYEKFGFTLSEIVDET